MSRLEHSRIVASFGLRKVETPTDGRTVVDYFLPYNGMTAKIWFDHNTREYVAYLVDDDGNQIGYSVRERMFLLIAKRAMCMTENAHEYLYDSERFHGMVEGGGLL